MINYSKLYIVLLPITVKVCVQMSGTSVYLFYFMYLQYIQYIILYNCIVRSCASISIFYIILLFYVSMS